MGVSCDLVDLIEKYERIIYLCLNNGVLTGCGIKDKDFPVMDVGIASAYITLAAEDEGVGSCILGWFDEKKIKELVGIPKSKRLMLIVTLGYAAKDKRKKERKEWSKVVSFDKYK